MGNFLYKWARELGKDWELGKVGGTWEQKNVEDEFGFYNLEKLLYKWAT